MWVRALAAYDGTEYAGFQRQVDVATVQEALEDALHQVTQKAVTIVAAGRTDAGVHAVGQVVAFESDWRGGPRALERAMNAVLPADVAVRHLARAEPGFHPRYDATRRHYRYSVHHASIRSPLARRYSLHVPYDLDLDAMASAAQTLVGEHDFATFGQPPQGDVTVRRVMRAEWRRVDVGTTLFGPDESAGSYLVFDIEGNAFLYRMVRSLVGTLLEVGQGRMSLREFDEAFTACDRGRAGKTAAPHGLCLMGVAY